MAVPAPLSLQAAGPANLGTNASLDVTFVPKFGPGRVVPTESPESGGVGGSRSGVP
jgi:hypothetical protein